MLATGSVDSTVRVWDVGEEILPHADEWTRVKRELFLGSSSSSGGERRADQKAARDKAIRLNDGLSPVPLGVVTLENALVRGQGDEDDGRRINPNDGSSRSSPPSTKGNGVASAAQAEPNQGASADETSAVAAVVEASKENARSALRSLRPEILRQARVRPAWRTGRVTAVLDRSACSLNHPAVAMGPAPGRGQKAKPDPLIEVQPGA